MSDSWNKEELTMIDKFKNEIELITENFGLNGKYVIGGLFVCSLIILSGYMESFLTNIIGVVYPAFRSIRAIESQELDNDKQWLSYWVIFATLALFDLFSGLILFLFPYYFFIKFLFIIWLALPNFKGATIVYNKIITNLVLLKSIVDKYNLNKLQVEQAKSNANISEEIKIKND
jgi:receptor expression-enhancing protein 5/6